MEKNNKNELKGKDANRTKNNGKDIKINESVWEKSSYDKGTRVRNDGNKRDANTSSIEQITTLKGGKNK